MATPNKPFDANAYLEEAEKFQTHFVKPLIVEVENTLKAQLAPLVERVKSVEQVIPRVDRLEGSQRRAFAIWTGVAAAVGLFGSRIWSFIKAHLGFITG